MSAEKFLKDNHLGLIHLDGNGNIIERADPKFLDDYLKSKVEAEIEKAQIQLLEHLLTHGMGNPKRYIENRLELLKQ